MLPYALAAFPIALVGAYLWTKHGYSLSVRQVEYAFLALALVALAALAARDGTPGSWLP